MAEDPLENEPEVTDASAERIAVEAELWEAFIAGRDGLARARVILFYLPFARRVARSVLYNSASDYLSLADLVQLATVGLIEAVDRFDPGRKIPFRMFAEKRVRGAVLNGISELSEMHAQQSYRQRLRRERVQMLGPAKPSKGSEAFSDMVELALGLAVGFMLEGTNLFQQTPESAGVGYGEPGELAAKSELFRKLVEHLPDAERLVLELHYTHSLQFTEVGRIMGLSKGRISQLHSRALVALRKLVHSRPVLDLRA